MTFAQYFKDRIFYYCINFALYLFMAIVALLADTPIELVLIIFLIWFVPLFFYTLIDFLKFKHYLEDLTQTAANLDKKYLVPDIIDAPEFIEGKLIHEFLQDSHRAMHENVKHYQEIQQEYQEYIESWVHEIKTPVASIMLSIENHAESIPSYLPPEVKKIENYIEQVLYYSRSQDVSRDYIVKPFNLDKLVKQVVKKNASDLISKRISIEMSHLEYDVYTDPKWVEFILNQIVGNAIKYCRDDHRKLKIYSEIFEHHTILHIKDNGIGISEQDLPRVFDKGFTGENGRLLGKSTGIGLYLCKKLCDRLGLGLSVESVVNRSTTVSIVFPIGEHGKLR